jgi:hypothetical protein
VKLRGRLIAIALQNWSMISDGCGFSTEARGAEPKVLGNFVDGERLLETPVSYKKRSVSKQAITRT